MIWAWTVTSRAVVGSSAISTAGSSAIAMAIMMRCRMPPENWCGKALTRALAPGICTRSISRTAWSSASDLFIPRCLRNISPICQPTGNTGFSELSASWKTMEISGPRITRRVSSSMARMFWLQ